MSSQVLENYFRQCSKSILIRFVTVEHFFISTNKKNILSVCFYRIIFFKLSYADKGQKQQTILFLCSLCAVLGTALVSLGNALSIKLTADDVVTYTGKVLYSTAADKNHGVFLQVVTDTGNVAPNFDTVGKSYSCNLSLCGVRLLRSLDSNLGANASLLRIGVIYGNLANAVDVAVQCGGLGLIGLVLSAVLYQLIECRHSFVSSFPEN